MTPVLFIGHGSPMNAIHENEYTKALYALGRRLSRPRAILAVSAHWMTKGTWLTHMPEPPTIHDFSGFPRELNQIQYPAPGDPALAENIKTRIATSIQLDDSEWGLDHGSWAVLRHVFPGADVPVVQLSLDRTQPPEYHFELGRKLEFLRAENVLILASGNVVHNLRAIDWHEAADPASWALEFDEWVKARVSSRDERSLVESFKSAPGAAMSVPTIEHFLPFLYALGATSAKDQVETIFEGIQNASISMRSLIWSR